MPADTTAESLHTRIAKTIAELDDAAFVIIGEPEGQAPPRKPGLRGLLSPKPRPAATRYVQFANDDDDLRCECIGAASFGGPYEIDERTDLNLRALGWKAPDEIPPTMLRPETNYLIWSDTTAADGLATLVIDTFLALGLNDFGSLEFTTG